MKHLCPGVGISLLVAVCLIHATADALGTEGRAATTVGMGGISGAIALSSGSESIAPSVLLAATTGSLKVTIQPAAAVTAGARWRVDAGVWRTSGTTATGLAPGSHTVSYNTLTGWTAPKAVAVTLLAGQTTSATGTYAQVLQPGSVSVVIEPSPARDAGARWRLDSGAWITSGTVLGSVPAGTHTVSFNTVSGWTTPATATVTVKSGAKTSLSRVFTITLGNLVVFGYNDLGMHCMNQDFSEFMILPPYNTVHAQVIRRGSSPEPLTENMSVSYRLLNNTTSVSKTNFWQYAPRLFGVSLPPDVGLTGNRLSGTMKAVRSKDHWEVTGIPVTPINDAGKLDPYPLAEITVSQSGTTVAKTATVVPVSWEISCEICHGDATVSPSTDILRDHDRLHGTRLEQSKPVVCGSCHAQAPLGLSGAAGVPSLSSAMHSAHAPRMAQANLQNNCYACHPGFKTQCQRDIHFAKGIDCEDCHGNMAAVGNPVRRPWVDEPRCGSCHVRSGFQFEEPGKLFRESKGHHGIECAVCHGSPHAITPTVNAQDNVQALMIQGRTGPINKCTVCHVKTPEDSFDHQLDDD